MKMLNDFENIIWLFWKYWIDGFVNIVKSNSKDLEYSPLHDEISIDSNENISTKLVIIKNNKKASFWIDWFWVEKIENAIIELLKVVEYWEYDKDIVLPEITDKLSKDFSWNEIKNIDFDYLESQFNNFKNYNFNSQVSIEWFSIGYKEVEHIYINSLWSIKSQIDNSSFYFYELFADNWDFRESDYEYKTFKTFPELKTSDIKKLEDKLLNKIKKSTTKLESGIYNITLQNDVVSNFIEIILDNLWAESIKEWVSLFSKNNIWDKIFWENLSIINNPDLPWYTWNLVFDWEWVTQQKKYLFQNWVLKNKFYDYKNALKDWLENLGCSWTSNIEIEAETTNNYLKNSRFLFTNLMAFHTVDSTTWKFSLAWEWFLIENWEKTEFIKNISLSWDLITLFSNIENIGDDFLDYWNYKVPSMTFLNQKVI